MSEGTIKPGPIGSSRPNGHKYISSTELLTDGYGLSNTEKYEKKFIVPHVEKKTWIYIIAELDYDGIPHGPVKIGISKNPGLRVKTFNIGCPSGSLVIFHSFSISSPIARSFELSFHKENSHNQMHGEWFGLDPDVAVDLVRNHFNIFRHQRYSRAEIVEELHYSE